MAGAPLLAITGPHRGLGRIVEGQHPAADGVQLVQRDPLVRPPDLGVRGFQGGQVRCTGVGVWEGRFRAGQLRGVLGGGPTYIPRWRDDNKPRLWRITSTAKYRLLTSPPACHSTMAIGYTPRRMEQGKHAVALLGKSKSRKH